uniref:Uncharacterized protein n=1 Tax=Anguilla anguilla TaxID=7936 RepID=A0A0E9URS3_ANGAN
MNVIVPTAKWLYVICNTICTALYISLPLLPCSSVNDLWRGSVNPIVLFMLYESILNVKCHPPIHKENLRLLTSSNFIDYCRNLLPLSGECISPRHNL